MKKICVLFIIALISTAGFFAHAQDDPVLKRLWETSRRSYGLEVGNNLYSYKYTSAFKNENISPFNVVMFENSFKYKVTLFGLSYSDVFTYNYFSAGDFEASFRFQEIDAYSLYRAVADVKPRTLLVVLMLPSSFKTQKVNYPEYKLATKEFRMFFDCIGYESYNERRAYADMQNFSAQSKYLFLDINISRSVRHLKKIMSDDDFIGLSWPFPYPAMRFYHKTSHFPNGLYEDESNFYVNIGLSWFISKSYFNDKLKINVFSEYYFGGSAEKDQKAFWEVSLGFTFGNV